MDNYEIKEVIKLSQADIRYGDDYSKEGFMPVMVKIAWKSVFKDNRERCFPYWIKKEVNGQFKWTIDKKPLQELLDDSREFGALKDDDFLWTLAGKILRKLA